MDVMNDNYFDYVVSLIIDVFMFTIKSIFILAETLYLTLLPDRFRKMKVYTNGFYFLLCDYQVVKDQYLLSCLVKYCMNNI